MPITRKQFDLGINELVERKIREVYRFLDGQKQMAFTRDEIEQAVYGTLTLVHIQEHAEFNRALEKLVELGAVERRQVGAETYYAYRGPLEF